MIQVSRWCGRAVWLKTVTLTWCNRSCKHTGDHSRDVLWFLFFMFCYSEWNFYVCKTPERLCGFENITRAFHWHWGGVVNGWHFNFAWTVPLRSSRSGRVSAEYARYGKVWSNFASGAGNQGKAVLPNNLWSLPTAQLAGMFKGADLWPEGWNPSWDAAVYLRYLTRIASVNIQLY